MRKRLFGATTKHQSTVLAIGDRVRLYCEKDRLGVPIPDNVDTARIAGFSECGTSCYLDQSLGEYPIWNIDDVILVARAVKQSWPDGEVSRRFLYV